MLTSAICQKALISSTGLWWSLNNHWLRGYVLLAQKSKGLSSLLTQLVFWRINTDCRQCWLLHWPLQNKVSGRKAVMCMMLDHCWWWHWHLLFRQLREQNWYHLVCTLARLSAVRRSWTRTDWVLFNPSDWFHWLSGRVSASEGWLDFCHYLWLRAQPHSPDCISHILSSLDDPA